MRKSWRKSSASSPGSDLAAALAVIDLPQFLAGAPAARTLLRVVPVDRGASEVRVLARAGTRDLVALASPDEGSVTLYDEPLGAVTDVGQALDPGAPLVHDDLETNECYVWKLDAGEVEQAFADAEVTVKRNYRQQRLIPVAMEPRGALARLFVASFDRSWIDVLTINPTQPSLLPSEWQRIGPERP